ncbi:MAG: hypothetical protein DRP01_00005 [Archaeoglobales archaeon]|nr:MAG: hypothetical protein DRP01_00005 [Archaeoglobales archaeon]
MIKSKEAEIRELQVENAELKERLKALHRIASLPCTMDAEFASENYPCTEIGKVECERAQQLKLQREADNSQRLLEVMG